MWRSNTFVLLSSLAGPTLTTRPGPGSKILISPRSLVNGTPIIGVWKRGLTSTIYSSCILAGLWSHSRLARSSSSSQTHLVFVNIWQIDENDVGGILKQYKRSQFVWQKKPSQKQHQIARLYLEIDDRGGKQTGTEQPPLKQGRIDKKSALLLVR